MGLSEKLSEKIETIEMDVAVLKTDVTNLKSWQKAQNGSIRRVEAGMIKLLYWVMGVMITCMLTLVTTLIKGGYIETGNRYRSWRYRPRGRSTKKK